MTIICIEGPSAVGKTTLARALAERIGAVAVPEVNQLFPRPPDEEPNWFIAWLCWLPNLLVPSGSQTRHLGGNPMELNTARVFVTDLAEARSFYETALALPLKIDGESDGFLVFRPGGLDLIVEAVPVDAPDDDRVLVGRFTGLSFTVPDIHSKYTELRAKGVTFSGAPEPQAWGGTLATFMDPAGNGLQLVQERAV